MTCLSQSHPHPHHNTSTSTRDLLALLRAQACLPTHGTAATVAPQATTLHVTHHVATSLRPPPIPSPYRARARNGLTPSPLSTDDSPPEYSSSPACSSAAQATNNPRPRSSRVRRRVSYDHDHDHDHDYHARYSHPIPLRLVSIETQTDHRPSAPHATCDRPGS